MFMVSLQPISCRQHLLSAATGILLVPRARTAATGQGRFAVNGPATLEPSVTSTTFTGPVGERFQADTENAPVLNHSAPLRKF